MAGFATLKECEARMELKEEAQRRAPGKDTHFDYTCLPDTVDPRGPKGK